MNKQTGPMNDLICELLGTVALHDMAEAERLGKVVRSVLAARPAQQEPVAWQTVPTDPSIAACITGSMAVGGAIDGKQAALVYAAMLNAAPQPPEQEQKPVAGVVLRDNVPTLLQDKHIKQTDERLYKSPQAQQEQGELRHLKGANQVMLEALKAILEDIDSDHGTGYEYAKARAAIVKGEKT